MARRTVLATAVSLTVLLAACVADDPTIAMPDDDQQVTISGSAFDPSDLSVDVGARVTFTNDDPVGHTVTAGTPDDPTGVFDEPLPTQGASAEITFDEPGTFIYYCRIHPQMTGEVEVSSG